MHGLQYGVQRCYHGESDENDHQPYNQRQGGFYHGDEGVNAADDPLFVKVGQGGEGAGQQDAESAERAYRLLMAPQSKDAAIEKKDGYEDTDRTNMERLIESAK